jgi:SNF2 family DNA or RNA helicase
MIFCMYKFLTNICSMILQLTDYVVEVLIPPNARATNDNHFYTDCSLRNPVGLLPFQLFGVRFLIGNIKSIACGGFLCDDMGLGKTLQALSVAQILHNHSEL